MIRKKLVLLTLGLALIAAHLAACTSIQADEMQWETNGAGQITFSVRRNGSGFDVQVTSYGYDDRDDRFTITPDTGEVYAALARVMRDQRRVRRSLSLPGLNVGTWTTLQFSDGEHTIGIQVMFRDVGARSPRPYITKHYLNIYRTVEDVMAWAEGDPKVIYDYVTAQIEAGGQ